MHSLTENGGKWGYLLRPIFSFSFFSFPLPPGENGGTEEEPKKKGPECILSPSCFFLARSRSPPWGGEEPREEDLSVFRETGERDPSFDLTLSSSSSSETTKVFSSSSLLLLSSQRSVADQTEKGCCLGGEVAEVACEQAPFGGSRSRSGSVPLFLRPPPPPLSQRLNPSTFPSPPLPPRNGGNSRSSSKHIGGGEWLPSFPFPPPPPFFLGSSTGPPFSPGGLIK